MKTRIGAFQLSLIFTGLIMLFALLMMWPSKASYFYDAPNRLPKKPEHQHHFRQGHGFGRSSCIALLVEQ
jgi:hypothetical protein